ncbi:MarR family winged helix-turn-helix transcriptional regulator [Micromonospora citrea]|uniref:MarR family winged helix-turn-helix transcriptional regulator n=1 Tax=Micromonospora citrea TaxID=47855 RepID=UPI003C45F6E8
MSELSVAGALLSDLLIEVFRANSFLLAEGDELVLPFGLTSARWQVLGVVEHAPAPVAQVARLMGLSRQSVQQTADALERDGMITYRANPHHRRAKLMVITPQALHAMQRVREVQARWANTLAERYSEAELATALAVLRRLNAPAVAEEPQHHAETTEAFE